MLHEHASLRSMNDTNFELVKLRGQRWKVQLTIRVEARPAERKEEAKSMDAKDCATSALLACMPSCTRLRGLLLSMASPRVRVLVSAVWFAPSNGMDLRFFLSHLLDSSNSHSFAIPTLRFQAHARRKWQEERRLDHREQAGKIQCDTQHGT